MSWETAKAAIDILLENSTDVELPALGFYGGEPLLAWRVMHKCLEYARVRSVAKPLHFSLTTNGTLVTSEIARVLASFGVVVLVSLDGPETRHNEFRPMRQKGSNAFDRTLDGIRLLRQAYGSSAKTKIMINAVHGPWSDFQALEEFFELAPPPEINALRYRLSPVSHPAVNHIVPYRARENAPELESSKAELRSRWYESLASGEVDASDGNQFLRQLFESALLRIHKRPRQLLPDILGPMGMCIPGVRKFYVDVHGTILPCERVSESFVLGNVHETGICPDRCEALLKEITSWFEGRCKQCVFCRLCNGCIASYVDGNGRLSEQRMAEHCLQQQQDCGELILQYVDALEANANCFDYMKEIAIS
jgi:uncharacterized protein